MDVLNIYTITAVSVLDVFLIGCACAFCPCFKKKFKIIYLSILLCLINFFFFSSGSLINISYYSGSFVKSSSVGHFFILFVVLKFFYDRIFKNTRKNNTLKLSLIVLFLSGIDCFFAGVASAGKNFPGLSALIVFLSFGFTISGFYGSRLLITAKQMLAEKLI
jgi:hypothetical protein